MATVIEREVHHDHSSSDSGNGAVGAIVAIIAVVVIIGIALFALRAYPFGAGRSVPSGSTPLNVNVQGQLPVPTGTTPSH